MTHSDKINAVSQALIAAHRSRQAIETPYATLAPANAEEAYAIQLRVWNTVSGGGERPNAFKVALPAPDAEPIAAPVFAHTLVNSGAKLSAKQFRIMGIETEIGVRFGRSLPPRSTPYTREEILDAVASAHVALELVDTRLADREAAGPLWRLADSMVNGGLVIGDEVADWRELDPATVIGRSFASGHLISETQGKHPTGDPYFLLPWWANVGSRRYGGILPGDFLTLGSWNGMHLVDIPGELRAELVGLGEACVSIVD